jgi:hypothetical protein
MHVTEQWTRAKKCLLVDVFSFAFHAKIFTISSQSSVNTRVGLGTSESASACK